MLRVSGLRLSLDFKEKDLREAAARKLGLRPGDLGAVRLVRKSVDARKKDRVHFVCAAEVDAGPSETRLLSRLRDSSVRKAEPYEYVLPDRAPGDDRPVVVGLGPAGLFAALILARCGLRPFVLERGLPVEEREQSVKAFHRERILDPESNIQFGEGGAGAFSDGKLTTGTGDGRIRFVLEELVKAGAPEEILVEAKPHIGTDRLPSVVRNIRQEIVALGGEVIFSAKLTDLLVTDGALRGVRFERRGKSGTLECRKAILAVGHSARDVFEMLCKLNVPMTPKAFSVGARIEHLSAAIDRAQYGAFAGHPALGAADYKLSCHLPDGRGVYTFCMCPGGTVTGAASEPGGVVTNGMSVWARDGRNSNAALLAGVTPEDFGSSDPLAGVAFQRRIEQAAYRAAGGDYSAPVQRVEDFLARRPTRSFGEVYPTYEPGVVPGELDACLPEFVTDAMRAALPVLGRQLKGFDSGDALLTAPETRSSSPVRILRNESLESPAIAGVYPCGEGAGHAGGIVSAAVDGLRCAEALMEK